MGSVSDTHSDSDVDADADTKQGTDGEADDGTHLETNRSGSSYDAVPDRLKAHDRWICWTVGQRDGKPTKKPIDPRNGQFASTTDPSTWASFGTAVEKAESGVGSGIGFVFTADGPFVGVDLDDCRAPDTGERSEQAAEIIETLDSYTEISPSGTGFHVIAIGELPAGRNRDGDVEMYEESRYFTVTGDRVTETPPDVRRRMTELEAVHRDHLGATPTEHTSAERTSAEHATDASPERSSLSSISDTELIDRAKGAENGAKFARLWRGTTTGYPSHSEADMALCCLLAFWTGCDPTRMDRLFRSSGLMRDKWDEQHFADGSSYGEKTIERAITVTDDVYDPDAEDGRGEKGTGVESFPTPGDALSATESDTERSEDHSPERELRRLRKENALLRDKMQEYAEVIDRQDETIRSLRTETHSREPNRVEQTTSEQAPSHGPQRRESEQPAVTTNEAAEDQHPESDTGRGRRGGRGGEAASNSGGLLDRLRSLL